MENGIMKWVHTSQLNTAIAQQHMICQYFAMIGSHLLEYRADDSHTNFGWDSNEGLFIGRPVHDYHLTFDPLSLEIHIVNSEQAALATLSMINRTLTDGLQWIKLELNQLGVDSSPLTDKLHYELPNHRLLHGATIEKIDREISLESIRQRSAADAAVRNAVVVVGGNPDDTRIWPHHFDTGNLLPTMKDEQMVASIGLGYAIAEPNLSEPYFYVNVWSKEGHVDLPDDRPDIPGYWVDDAWTGGVLPVSDIWKADLSLISVFYSELINYLHSLISTE